MTLANPIPAALQQHLVLDGVSWDFYERVLTEIGDSSMRVSFDNGSIEIMAPLAEHENPKEAIGSLIDVLTLELNIPIARFGSTTFRREDRLKGLEPDKCYYLANADRVRGMKAFDPAIHPPPDLAIEIEVTRRSIPRQPIYAGLGVPELWRYDSRKRLTVLLLSARGDYVSAERSPSFPLIPMDRFAEYVRRMEVEEQTSVLRAFREWVRSLVGPN